MTWNLKEALDYYQEEGAPEDQNVLIHLLSEIQEENGGTIPAQAVTDTAQYYEMKESLLLALIRRIPRLKITEKHCLSICCGQRCRKSKALSEFAEKHCSLFQEQIEIRYENCMRMCGMGPNIKWDGVMYHHADEKMISSFLEQLK